ncbi:MAG TPA: hypothetical protein VIC04_05375, partial [Terriglobia bacterium]
VLFAVLLISGWAVAGSADVLILKTGQAVPGRFQGGDPTGVTFLVDGQYRRYDLTEVQSITIAPLPAAPAASAPAPTPAPAYSSGRSGTMPSSSGATYSSAPAQAAPPSLGITLGAGTVITVRMIDTVDSSVHQTGQTFRASLDEPLMFNSRVIAPRGADVTTKLVSVEEAGRIQGRSELALILYDITINGHKYEITSEEVTQSGASRGAQSAKRIGGLAVLGAVIGGIAAGGKGAAQGAAAGAGAGTAIQVMTHGEKVQIPAESRLDFTLSSPVAL